MAFWNKHRQPQMRGVGNTFFGSASDYHGGRPFPSGTTAGIWSGIPVRPGTRPSMLPIPAGPVRTHFEGLGWNRVNHHIVSTGEGHFTGPVNPSRAIVPYSASARGSGGKGFGSWLSEPAWKGAGFSRGTAGRYLGGASLGLFALNRAAATWDSARYRDPIGVAWNATLTAGAGYAAYHMLQTNSSIRGAAGTWINTQITHTKSNPMIKNLASTASRIMGRK